MTTEVQARPDTIAPQAGNVEIASPEVLTTAEAAPVEAVETVVEPTPEVKAPPRGIADFSDDELAEEPKVKDLLRRREQSARDRTQAEADQRALAASQQYVARTEYVEEIASAFTVSEDGVVTPDRRRLNTVTEKIENGLTARVQNETYRALNDMLPHDGLTAAQQQQLRSAGPQWVAQYLDLIAEARAEQRLPGKRTEWEADYRKQQEARATVQARETASAARTTTGATPVTGRAAVSYGSQRDIDRAHMNGDITTAQLKELRDSGQYAALEF